jgi:hypothetical protein
MFRFSLLTISEKEWYEERAAILEYEANMSRIDAQRIALDCTERYFMINFEERRKEK